MPDDGSDNPVRVVCRQNTGRRKGFEIRHVKKFFKPRLTPKVSYTPSEEAITIF